MTELDLKMVLYYHNIGMLGSQGQGKTTKAKKIIEMYPNVPRWIWSPQRPKENFDGETFGYFVDSIDQLERGFFVFTGDYTEKNFIAMQKKAMQTHDLWLIIDDCHEQCSKQYIPDEWKTTILSGRNRGIFSMFLSPEPNNVHNTILGSCQHMFSFKLALETHIEWVKKNRFGDEAWILLPRTHRKFDKPEWPDVLPDRSYLYRDRNLPENQLMIAGQDFQVDG